MNKSKISRLVPVAMAFCIYSAALLWVQTGRHLSPPPGSYASSIEGVYKVERDSNHQIPDVFFSTLVTIADSQNGRIRIEGEDGKDLALEDAADGWYFSQEFFPKGARIAPGISRNWNEGRITATGNGLVVEGHTAERGLVLFLFPFSDSPIQWSVRLTEVNVAEEQAEQR